MSDGNGLPPGWVQTDLASIGKLFCGQSPPTAEVNQEGHGVPYVTGPDQWDGSAVRLDKWTTSPKRMVPDGCVFITVKGAGVGTLFPGVVCAIGRDVYAYKSTDAVSWRFIQHALRHTINEVVRNARGDIPGLSKSHILEHSTAIPPRKEQDRIVAKIEELFSDLDAGIAALERARANLKRYRAAVLKSAVEGKLTKQWRADHPDVEPASELLQRILTDRRHRWEQDQLANYEAKDKQPPKGWKDKYKEPAEPDVQGLPELPDGWCWAGAEQLTSPGRSIMYGIIKAGPDTEGGVPYVRVMEMKTGTIDVSTLKRCHPDRARKFARATLRQGDILVSKDGTIGKVAIVPPELEGGNITQHVLRFSTSEHVDARYVARAIEAPSCQRWMKGETKGVALQGVNVEDFRQMPIPLPPTTEQVVMREAIDDAISVAESNEELIERSEMRASCLRQAILKRAVEGHLVPQDLNDEPATELLARIKAGRETDTSNKKAKKTPKANAMDQLNK